MSADDDYTELRVLALGPHSDELVATLTHKAWPDYSLQLIGDGLLGAVRNGTGGAAELAISCITELRARDWDGDRDLAEILDAALGNGPSSLLREIPIDLEDLALVLEGDPLNGGGSIDLTTGEVWPQFVLESARENGEIDEDDESEDDPDRWLNVDCEGSRPGYRDMVWFIEHLDDPAFANRLAGAISGRGAFRRFKDTLNARPDLLATWYAFSNDRQRGRARHWLVVEGITPSAAPS